jgi:GTP-binding nuclear protein Ran
MQNYTFTIIGDANTGKKTFINRLCNGQFNNTFSGDQIIQWEDNNVIKITMDSTKTTDGYVLFFDIHNPESFQILEQYLSIDKPMVLCGNKCDLKNEDENEDEEEKWYIKKFRGLEKKNIKFYQISCKSNYNFDKPFVALLERLKKI